MKASIIIPFYNKWSLTHSRMMELNKFIPPMDIEIILVDDASTEPKISSAVRFWREASNHTVRYKPRKKNGGFGASMNYGAEVAEGDVLIFLSNDVMISGDFVSEITNILEEKPNGLIGGEVIYYPGGWNEVTIGTKTVVIPYANGWLLACKKDTWEMLGGFDPRYGKYDYEDIDLSTTATINGCDIIALNSKHVKHLVAGTIGYNPERLEQTKKNREVYLEKWKTKLQNLLSGENYDAFNTR